MKWCIETHCGFNGCIDGDEGVVAVTLQRFRFYRRPCPAKAVSNSLDGFQDISPRLAEIESPYGLDK
jgi:hypothetical protein